MSTDIQAKPSLRERLEKILWSEATERTILGGVFYNKWDLEKLVSKLLKETTEPEKREEASYIKKLIPTARKELDRVLVATGFMPMVLLRLVDKVEQLLGDSSKGGDLEVSKDEFLAECLLQMKVALPDLEKAGSWVSASFFKQILESKVAKEVMGQAIEQNSSSVVSHPCTSGNAIEQEGSVIEFCYRWPDKRIEVKYRRVSGTVECDVMLNEIKTLQEKFGEECPYFWRFENGIH